MTGLVRDDPGGGLLRWVRDDAIAIGDRVLTRSCALHAGGVMADWPVTAVEAMTAADLDALLDSGCTVILLGTGTRPGRLAPDLQYRALSRGVGIEVMTNDAAARTWALLAGEGRDVLAAFILPATAPAA